MATKKTSETAAAPKNITRKIWIAYNNDEFYTTAEDTGDYGSIQAFRDEVTYGSDGPFELVELNVTLPAVNRESVRKATATVAA